jgi:hypothetical protein
MAKVARPIRFFDLYLLGALLGAGTSAPNISTETRLERSTRLSYFRPAFPQAKRAARQQGDPFSMGGSSNGGKAIGTLWCKSMFASRCCQECFAQIIKHCIISNLRQILQDSIGFFRLSSKPAPKPV